MYLVYKKRMEHIIQSIRNAIQSTVSIVQNTISIVQLKSYNINNQLITAKQSKVNLFNPIV